MGINLRTRLICNASQITDQNRILKTHPSTEIVCMVAKRTGTQYSKGAAITLQGKLAALKMRSTAQISMSQRAKSFAGKGIRVAVRS